MILAAGMTPAWQQTLVFESLQEGAVNRAAEAYWCSAGKVLNVGVALHHLGGPQRTLASIGGATGRQIEADFQALGADGRWVWTQSRTRVCTTLVDRERRLTTELVENGPHVEEEEVVAFKTAFADAAAVADVVVLTGSLPAGAPKTLYRELLSANPCRAVLDVRGDELLHALEAKPFLVKPNRDELAATLARDLPSRTAITEAMAELRERGATWVVVTQGDDDVLVQGPSGTFACGTLATELVNPIGCGDCLAAGLAWGLARGMNVPRAVALGIACAAQNAAALLPGRLSSEAAERMAARVEVRDGASG